MEIGCRRLLLLPIPLGDKQDDLVFGERCFDCCERRWPPNEQWNDYIGENDNIPKRKDRNAVRRRDALVVALEGLGQVVTLPSSA
jgi:hypothetical protein